MRKYHILLLGVILRIVVFASADILQYHIYAQTLDTIVNETKLFGAKVFPNFNVGRLPLAIAVKPDTNMVYVTNSRDETISVIDINSMKVSPITVGDHPLDIAVN